MWLLIVISTIVSKKWVFYSTSITYDRAQIAEGLLQTNLGENSHLVNNLCRVNGSDCFPTMFFWQFSPSKLKFASFFFHTWQVRCNVFIVGNRINHILKSQLIPKTCQNRIFASKTSLLTKKNTFDYTYVSNIFNDKKNPFDPVLLEKVGLQNSYLKQWFHIHQCVLCKVLMRRYWE